MVDLTDCTCNLFERIDGFSGLNEFKRFQGFLEDLVNQRILLEVELENKYAGFPEQWFKCAGCNQIWTPVHPDFPYKGLWEKVNLKINEL